MKATSIPTADAPDAGNRIPPFALAVVFIFVLFAVDSLDGASFYADVDDKMRLLQIRDLLGDGQWHDLTMPFISMPEPYFSPWSRLVDAPYVLLTSFFGLFFPAETALGIATSIWPPLLFVAFAWLVWGMAVRVKGSALSVAETVAFLAVLIFASLEFSPGRIDHHNAQMLAVALAMRGVLVRDPVRAGLIVAAGVCLSVSIGLEAVPLLFVLIGALVVVSVSAGGREVLRMQAMGAGLFVMPPVLAMLLLGPQNALAGHCDAFSAVWIAILMASGIVLCGVPLFWRRSAQAGVRSFMLRLLSLAVPGVAAFAAVLWTWPECMGGPYHMIDAAARDFWLTGVPQEASFLQFFTFSAGLVFAGLMVAMAAAVAAAFLPALRAFREGKPDILILWLVACVSVVLALVQTRYIRFPFFMVAVFMPLAVFTLKSGVRAGASRLAGAATAIVLILTGSAYAFSGNTGLVIRESDYLAADSCKAADYSVVRDIPPSRILAPFGLTYGIVDQHAGHRLLAMEFHRAAPGISKMARIFGATGEQPLAELLAPVDYVVVCRRDWKIEFPSLPLFETLSRGERVKGFELVEGGEVGRLAIYRVDHDRL
jgi:hypothetical protein